MYIKLILKHFFYKFIGWMSPKGIVANLPIFFGMLCGVAVADTNLPGNHIHNFSNNIWDKTSVDWALPVFHAHELGYQLVTIGKPKNFNFDDLKIIKISNAYYFPARVDTSTKSVQYIQWVDDGKGTSLLRDNRKTYKWYKLDEIDLQLMETYGCRRDNNVKMTGSSNLIAIKQAFYTDWDTGSVTIPIYNFQSKFAVRRLVNNILQSYSMGDYSALFIDDLSREIPGCENKDSGEEGSYRTWKDGQKDFVVQINSELKRRYLGRDLIFGNVWHPLNPGVARTYLKWFADGSLKLDHYYLEAGPQKNTSIVANGVDLLTARPA